MRVIAGIYRSRLLSAPRGSATRPTSDRLRETLFNILAPRLPGCRFADLYAGSGAVGIEAFSRGAGHVLFAESAPSALAAIRANLAALGITSSFTMETRRVGDVIRRLSEDNGRAAALPLDIVFLDPPWEAAEEYAATLGLLGGAVGGKLLGEGAVVVAEHAARSNLCKRYGLLCRTRAVRQGDAALTFFAADESVPNASLDDYSAGR